MMTEKIVDGKVVGEQTGASITKRWVPKEWRPEYEAMVALSCTGLSNEEVGKRFGYGKQQVSNIINTPQGKKLREIILNRLRQTNEETFAERISQLQNTALKNIEVVLEDVDLLNDKPLAMFDRSQKFLESTAAKGMKTPREGDSDGVKNVNIQNNTVIINGETRDSLAESLLKADKAKEVGDGLSRSSKLIVGAAVNKGEKSVIGEEVRKSDNGRVETPTQKG